MSNVALAEVYEGTWEEMKKLERRFNGHRLRVTVLSKSEASPPPLEFKPSGHYAARMAKELKDQPEPTPEEIEKDEKEVRELIQAINETRRRGGAEPISA